MPTTYSPSLKIALLGTGENVGTWGTLTNTNLGTLLEQAITGVQTITMANADYPLTNADGALNEARNAVLSIAGSNAAVRDIIAPTAEKVYIIHNGTTGGKAIRIRAATGAAVTIANGATVCVYFNGTNFIQALNDISVAAGTNMAVTTVGNTTTVAATPTPIFTGLSKFTGATSNTTAGVGTLALRGGQIGFPATQVPSTDVNTLDDYQEGSWMPTIGGSVAFVGTNTSSFLYTKIGRQVTLNMLLRGSTSVQISSSSIIPLPFAAVGSSSGTVVGSPTSGSGIYGVYSAGSNLNFFTSGSAPITTSGFYISITYFAAT
jgi:hypothetical protein